MEKQEITFSTAARTQPNLISVDEKEKYTILHEMGLVQADQMISVDTSKIYYYKFSISAGKGLFYYVGFISYDDNKEGLTMIRVNKINGTEVKVTQLDDNEQKVYISPKENLRNWSQSSVNYCIGVYKRGDMNEVIPLSQVIASSSSQQPYSALNYEEGYLKLTKEAWEKLKAIGIVEGTSYLANHCNGGTYSYTVYSGDEIKSERTFCFKIHNEIVSGFRPSTKFIRPLLLINKKSEEQSYLKVKNMELIGPENEQI